MTNNKYLELAKALRENFKHIDIRSDQCELVRMITPSLSVGCEVVNEQYQAKVVSHETDSGFDFDTELLETIQVETIEELVQSIKKYL